MRGLILSYATSNVLFQKVYYLNHNFIKIGYNKKIAIKF